MRSMKSAFTPPEPEAPGMITVQTRITVDDHGVATLRLPPDITPGPHEAVVVIEEALAQNKASSSTQDKTSIREWLPRHDVPWPFSPTETFRREDMYGDDGR